MIDKKVCSKCREEKPVDCFNKDKRYADGFFCWCRECMIAYQKNRLKDPTVKEKTRKRNQKYYQENKEAIKERNNEWCRNAWHNDPDYRKRKKIQKKKIHERKFGVDMEWTEKYRLWRRRARRKRRAALAEANGRFTDEQFKALCKKYGNVCLACGQKKKLAADHVVPLSLGGSNDISNIQPLCKSCNSQKHCKIIDYRPSQ